MKTILMLLLIALLAIALSRSLRQWLLMLIIQRIQRRMVEQMRQSQHGQRARQGDPNASSGSDRRSTPPGSKLDMQDIEAKRFEQASGDEYVDFEELPR